MRKCLGHRLWFVFILSVLARNGIYAQETGIMQKTTCEFDTMRLSCDNNFVINIISAFYGRTNRETCPSSSDGSTTCSANNALQKVQGICQNQRTCKVVISNDVFGDPCAGVLKYINVSYECKLSEWVMVFKGVANAGLPDLYELWHENSSLNALDDAARALDDKHMAHFKSPIVERWSELNVKQVKISFYINDEEEAFISFNGSGTNKENWFTKNNIIGSSYYKLKENEFNFFSLAGHHIENVYRRFFTSTMYGGCPNDFGFSVVLTQQGVCHWEYKGTPHPVIMISPDDDAVRWQSDSPDFADFFAIFIDFSDPACSHDVVTIDDVTYTFEASPSEFLAHSLELCNLFDQNHPLAVRMCITNPGGGADWGEVTVKKCEININTLAQVTVNEENVEEVSMELSTLTTNEDNIDEVEDLNDLASILEDVTRVGAGNTMVTNFTVKCEININTLAQVTVNEENVEEVAMELSTLTTNEENINKAEDINDVASILEDVTRVGAGNARVTNFTVKVVSNIQEADDSVFTTDNETMAASLRIVQSLEKQLTALTDFKEVQNNVAVQTNMYTPEDLENGIGYASIQPENGSLETGFTNDNIETFEEADDFLMDMIETSIALPSEVIYLNQEQTGSNQIQVSFIVYKTSKLFTSNRLMSKKDRVIGSRVVSATVERVVVEDLKEPVRAAYLPVVDGAEGNPECVFWDFALENGNGDWSNNSCYYNKTSEGRIVCYCDHLTNFAVIMDYSGQEGEVTTFDEVLTYLSIIGCVISIFCLTVTILTFTYFKHLRGKRPQRILINLCVSLLLLYLTFVIGIELTFCYYCCIVVAILLHYFVLTSLFWMLVEAINMYLKFVLVFYEEIRFFMFKSVLLGWVVPVIPVVVIAVLDYETYSNDHYCFMKPGMQLYFGLITISAIILIINVGIYAQIIRRLTCRRRVTKIKNEKERMNEVAVRVQNAIAIMMLLGLTWLFGFFAIDSSDAVNDISQLLFCVFNSLQGFFIFLLFCVRRKDVRDSWAYCCCKIGQKPGLFTTTTSRQRYATEKTTVSGNSVSQGRL